MFATTLYLSCMSQPNLFKGCLHPSLLIYTSTHSALASAPTSIPKPLLVVHSVIIFQSSWVFCVVFSAVCTPTPDSWTVFFCGSYDTTPCWESLTLHQLLFSLSCKPFFLHTFPCMDPLRCCLTSLLSSLCSSPKIPHQLPRLSLPYVCEWLPDWGL